MKLKKFLAGALALCIIGGAMPLSAAVAEESGDGVIISDVSTSGKFGDISWILDQQTGLLTLSGEGPVVYEGYSPWNDLHQEITAIVVEEGITSLPESVFSLCYAQTLDLPSTLTEIGGLSISYLGLMPKLTEIRVAEGSPAFVSVDGVLFDKDMTALLKYPIQKPGESYTVPEGVKTLTDAAFFAQRCLTSVTLPEGLETIGEAAFYNCKALAQIDIPESVTEICGNAFPGTPWLAEKQAEDPLVIVNDILVNGLAAEGKVIIPDGVRRIAPFSFENNTNITEVGVPETVESLGKSAFFNCTALVSIELAETKEIGVGAFCGCSALQKVDLYQAKKIDMYAFGDCPALGKISIYQADCEIWDDSTTICSGGNDKDGYSFTGVITCRANSTAQAYAEKYGYDFVLLPDDVEYLLGDANGDGKVDLSDAVAVLQYVALPAKYPLDEPHLRAADVVDKDTSGVNGIDALAIMMVDAGLIQEYELPVTSEKLDEKLAEQPAG
ncbi:MAG: leucine-rich repeat protein [Ruminococcus sp.]|nr:leucine-rich repeat protein [Ruminococcus sp.]